MSLSAPFKPITLGIIGCFASVWAAPGAEGILGALMSLCMLGICICDSRRFIIPNKLVAAAFVLAMVDAALGATGSLWMALALPLGRSLATAGGLIVFMKSYELVRKREGLGLGDVKLAMVGAAWLNWLAFAYAVEFAALAALAVHMAKAGLKGVKIDGQTAVPFGLYLAPMIWFGWLFQSISIL